MRFQRLGERESGTARLEEAVAAYRAALEERTRERVPPDWAMTQNNLGDALSRLGEREAETDKAKGCATLKTARDHYAAALEEFQKAGASYYVEVAQGNIAQARWRHRAPLRRMRPFSSPRKRQRRYPGPFQRLALRF